MYAGAAVCAVLLISALVLIIVGSKAGHATLNGHTLHGRSVPITVAAVFGLVVIALWLWMARATGQGRNWARILSTVLFGLATLQLRGVFGGPVGHLGVGLIVLGLVVPVLGWLVGPGRGVAAVAPGLQRVLQAAGLPAGRARCPAVVTG